MAFILSAFLTILFSFVYLLVSKESFKEQNALDDWVWARLSSLSPSHTSDARRKVWQTVLEKVILSLSDQQLLTGLAILTAGLLRHCSLSVYHFEMVYELAWFSSSTHMTSLSALRNYLFARPRLRNWRVCLMAVMFCLLVAYVVMSSHRSWYESWPYRAQCLFDNLIGNISGTPSKWMICSLTILSWGYLSNSLALFETPSRLLAQWIFEKPVTALEKGIKALRNKRQLILSNSSDPRAKLYGASILAMQIVVVIVETIYFVIITSATSCWFSLMFDITWFATGLYSIISTRQIPDSKTDGDENELTFGQIVPLLLLGSTILVIKEGYEGECYNLFNECKKSLSYLINRSY